MDARLVWHVWRRILRSDPLVTCVVHDGGASAEEVGSFNAAERAILSDYAATPVPTESNIGMYRRGLIRNALGALNFVPLTRRLLYSRGLDVESIAADFTRSVDFRDYGPNFWEAAGAFIHYLKRLAKFETRLCQDVLSLDAAMVALVRRLAESPVEIWPDSAAAEVCNSLPFRDSEPVRFSANRAAIVVSSHYDLGPWIEAPDEFDANEELSLSSSHWLIYFPSPEGSPAYAALSERAARVFTFLSTPQTASEISLALGGLQAARVNSLIDSLVELGVVLSEGVRLSLDSGFNRLTAAPEAANRVPKAHDERAS